MLRIFLFLNFILSLKAQETMEQYVFCDSLVKYQFISFHEPRVIQSSTEQIWFNKRLLQPEEDYAFYPALNKFQLLQTLTNDSSTLFLSYSVHALSKFHQRNKTPDRFEIDSGKSSVKHADEAVKEVKPSVQLNKSGVFYRGFRLSSAQQLKLESGMNLNIQGTLGDSLVIKSVLTDERTPIQPEGTTRYISDLDKIYVSISHPNFNAHLGDFKLDEQSDPLFKYDHLLQGVNLNTQTTSYSHQATVASLRGNSHVFKTITSEGLQGPYQLTGIDNEIDLVVIAGSETVYLDGRRLERGELHDYVIEYGNATITFTGIHVRGNQNLVIEFEYISAGQKFGKNFYRYEAGYTSDQLKLDIQLSKQTDDTKNLLDGSLPFLDSDRERLKEAGDQKEFAIKQTALVSDDGTYIKEIQWDTNDSVFVYSPHSELRKYKVRFSFVGREKGRYKRISRFRNEYVFVGEEQGSYEPIEFLSMPTNHHLAALSGSYSFTKHQAINFRLGISEIDKNTFSSLDDTDNRGLFTGLTYRGSHTMKGLIDHFSYSNKTEMFTKSFEAFTPVRSVLFNETWGLEASGFQSDYFTTNAQVLFGEKKLWHLQMDTELINGKNTFSGTKQQYQWNLAENYFPQLDLEYKKVKSSTKNNSSKFNEINYLASLSKSIDQYTIKTDVSRLERETFFQRSYGYLETNTGFNVSRKGTFLPLTSYAFTYQETSLNDTTGFKPLPFYSNFSHRLNMEWRSKQMKNRLQVSYRNHVVDPFFESIELGEEKRKYIDLRYLTMNMTSEKSLLLQNKFSYHSARNVLKFDYDISLSNEQSALKESVYRNVSDGYGQFRLDSLDGRFYDDPIAGNYVRFILPTGEYEPVTKFNALIGFQFKPLKHSLFEDLKFTSRLRIEEESTNKFTLKQLYLHPATFQTQSTRFGTIAFRNEVFYNFSEDIEGHYTFQLRRSKTGLFIDETQGENNKQRKVQHSAQLNHPINNSLSGSVLFDYLKLKKEVALGNNLSRDLYELQSGYQLTYQRFGAYVTLNGRVGKGENYSVGSMVGVRFLHVKTTISYVFLDGFSFTGSFNVSVVKTNQSKENESIPYELAEGKRSGTNRDWQLGVQYKLLENVYTNLSYRGRSDVIDPKPFHFGQMEVRLVF